MALITCSECGKQISDQATMCVGCGAPVVKIDLREITPEITSVSFDQRNGWFIGTVPLIIKLAAHCILELRWRVDSVDETNGLITFTTGMTWGSFSGISGSLYVEEMKPTRFRVTGNAKQNLRGGQLVALNLFNESQKKVEKIVASMQVKVPNAPLFYDPDE